MNDIDLISKQSISITSDSKNLLLRCGMVAKKKKREMFVLRGSVELQKKTIIKHS